MIWICPECGNYTSIYGNLMEDDQPSNSGVVFRAFPSFAGTKYRMPWLIWPTLARFTRLLPLKFFNLQLLPARTLWSSLMHQVIMASIPMPLSCPSNFEGTSQPFIQMSGQLSPKKCHRASSLPPSFFGCLLRYCSRSWLGPGLINVEKPGRSYAELCWNDHVEQGNGQLDGWKMMEVE